ncbi:hypothetical protein D3C86_1310210 [compost metagenome]
MLNLQHLLVSGHNGLLTSHDASFLGTTNLLHVVSKLRGIRLSSHANGSLSCHLVLSLLQRESCRLKLSLVSHEANLSTSHLHTILLVLHNTLSIKPTAISSYTLLTLSSVSIWVKPTLLKGSSFHKTLILLLLRTLGDNIPETCSLNYCCVSLG